MKRKDLKPGTVYRYATNRFVTFAVDNIVLSAAPRATRTEWMPTMNGEVEVLWAPPEPKKTWYIEGRLSTSDKWKPINHTFGTYADAQAHCREREKAYSTSFARWEYRVLPGATTPQTAPVYPSKSSWPTPKPARKLEVDIDRGSLRPWLETLSDEDVNKLAEAAAEKTRRDLRRSERDAAVAREKRQEYFRSAKTQEALKGFCNFLAGAAHAMAARKVLRWYKKHMPIDGKEAQHGAMWTFSELHYAATQYNQATNGRAPWMWEPYEKWPWTPTSGHLLRVDSLGKPTQPAKVRASMRW